MPTQSVSFGHSPRSGIASSAVSAGTKPPKAAPPESAEDGDRTAIQNEANNGHENALKNRLNCNVGERCLREAGSVQCNIDGQINHQRSSREKGYRVKRIEFCLPHATVKHAVKNDAKRKSPSPKVREVLQAALRAWQPTMIRAPASISESPNFRAFEGFSLRTIAAIGATNNGMQPGLSAPPS
jgi:hypothetical protein